MGDAPGAGPFEPAQDVFRASQDHFRSSKDKTKGSGRGPFGLLDEILKTEQKIQKAKKDPFGKIVA